MSIVAHCPFVLFITCSGWSSRCWSDSLCAPQVAIRTHHWTLLNAVVIWGVSIGLWFPFMLLCSFLWQWWELLPDMSGVAQRLFAVPAFWLSAVVGAPAMAVLFDFSIMAFEDQFHPGDARIFQVCFVISLAQCCGCLMSRVVVRVPLGTFQHQQSIHTF